MTAVRECEIEMHGDWHILGSVIRTNEPNSITNTVLCYVGYTYNSGHSLIELHAEFFVAKMLTTSTTAAG